MAILFSACVSYSVMHVFVCLLEQYDVTSVFRVLLLSRMIITSFFSFYLSSGTLLFYYFFFFPQIHIPKIEMPKRKYDVNYLDYGFTFVEGRKEQLPQCVICHKTLSNDSMKPHQLKKHLSIVHPQFVGKFTKTELYP